MHYYKEDVQYGVNLDVTSYTNGTRETHNPPGRALPYTVWGFYKVRPLRCCLVYDRYCSVVGALNMLLVTVRHTCASFNPRRLVLSERLLPPLAQPSGFLGHSVECSVHPPRELWQHGRSKHVSTCTCQYRCGSSKLLKCVFIFNQISDTTGNSRLCSTL